MKHFIFLLGFTLLSLTLAEQYTDRYDDIDVDDILANKRLLTTYIKCILDQGRCTSEGKEVKLHIKDAMQTGCEKCTETQKQKARKVVGHIREHEKTYWEDMKKKYDPGDKYKEIYEAFLNAGN
ncbi:unnamed protein product [Euphydryas editha]|uniref:Chemosensory protein n=1 Tax=Euphydryas editha TaxID=104508 RepID=A0AAU9TR04_EUPED|nr:unnamed protein product [Euphydryas editha]